MEQVVPTISNLESRLLGSEKQLKQIKYTQEVQQVSQHLQLLREDALKKLIKSNDDRDMHIILGSLRTYDKIIALLV